MLACTMMTAWVRSWSNHEWIMIPVGTHSKLTGASSNHVLGLAYEIVVDPTDENQFDFWSNPGIGRVEESVGIDGITDTQWSVHLAGIRLGQSPHLPDFQNHIGFAVIPYWSIVVPLTLLSASLLLFKTNFIERSEIPCFLLARVTLV